MPRHPRHCAGVFVELYRCAGHGLLGYLTVWPTGKKQPVVSTLNAYGGQVTANAAIVPAGTGGDIEAYASDNTDLLIDINGYFDTPGQNGLSLYPTAPCRVIDTRKGSGAFEGELTVDVVDSVCGPPSAAQAYVFNATVVPSGSLGYLTLWADGTSQPVVSTLNAHGRGGHLQHGDRPQQRWQHGRLCFGSDATNSGHLQLLREPDQSCVAGNQDTRTAEATEDWSPHSQEVAEYRDMANTAGRRKEGSGGGNQGYSIVVITSARGRALQGTTSESRRA